MKYKNNKFVNHLTRGTIAFTLLFGASTGHAAGVLNVTNWAEYIAEDTIANFEKEFDVKVTYDNYDSEESIQSKLLAGSSGYDVVSHSSASVAKLIPANILQKVDKTKLPNLKHIMDSLGNQLDLNIDPGNHYFIPYMWGTHGVT
ncbi:MAG: ABC transporter substrate-binding protein, partial [Pseudomonadales bacterium]